MSLWKNIACRSAIIFLLCGSLWIIFTRYAIDNHIKNLGLSALQLAAADDISGIFLVCVSAIIIYLTINTGVQRLENSKQEYRKMFRENPAPLFIIDSVTGKFLAINEACCHLYGYTYADMKKLFITDILVPERKMELHEKIRRTTDDLTDIGYWKHKTRTHAQLWVHAYARNITYNKKEARLMLVIDVNESVIAKEKLLLKNQKLSDLAWFQSHELRAPIARVLGLLSLIDYDHPGKEENLVILNHLKTTGMALDEVVKKLSHKTIIDEEESRVA